MSKPKLNHLVSRFLTRSWEATNRDLVYYDFELGKVSRQTSKKLFAQKKAFPRHIENRYNALIETPLSAIVNKLRQGERPTELNEWHGVRAIHLLFHAQFARIIEAHKASERFLSTLLEWEDWKINAYLSLSMSDSRILIAPVEKGKFLFYPQIGIFSFAVQDYGCASGWSYGFGIPFTLNRAILLVSKSVNDEALNDVPIAELSVGVSDSNKRVVIPAQIAESCAATSIKSDVERCRHLGKAIIAEIDNIRQIMRRGYERLGYNIEKIPGSMHNKIRLAAHTHAVQST